MSLQFSSQQCADLRQHVRVLVEQIREHRELVESLAASTERDARHAEATALQATTADVDEARQLLGVHAQRTADGAATVRQLCEHACEQHAAACRLLTDLDENRARECRAKAVLVVDDYDGIREVVARILENAGFVVRTAVNGLEGLIAAYEMRPGVIVMDVAMPVLDGIEATRLIKASKATRDARVIAYTGNLSLDHGVAQTLFAAVLKKPAPADVVLATVAHMASL